jgi:outer membrane protein
MRFSPLAVGALLAASVAPLAAGAQSATAPTGQTPATGPTLTLEEAVAIARQNNPAFQSSLNQRRRVGAQLRSAYGALIPQASTSVGTSFREGRQQFFAGQAFGSSSDQLSSDVGVDVNARYNLATFNAPRLQRANAEAVEADIVGAEQLLRSNVTQQYLLALQQQARAQLQDSLVATAQAQLELAKARVAVGAATVLDVRRAEVTVGQQQVLAIQARNNAAVEKLRLFQQMGVEQPGDAQLTTRFAVTDAPLALPELLAQARQANPTVNALRSRERVASLGVRSAKGEYMPTLNLSAGVSGYGNQYTNSGVLVSQALGQKQGQCRQIAEIRQIAGQPANPGACSAITLTPAEIADARSGNGRLYDFTRSPYSINASLSIPIFNGFSREQRVQEAVVLRNEAEYNTRAQELRLNADVTSAFLTLQAQRQTVALQEQNAATAREALMLAQERYRVGASSFIDVSQARDAFAQAQTDHINAVYEFHRAFAALENAVGRPLR